MYNIYILHCVIAIYRSVNEVICHGIPDARPLENGDIVNGKEENVLKYIK